MDTQQDFDAWMRLPRRSTTASSSSSAAPVLAPMQLITSPDRRTSKRQRGQQVQQMPMPSHNAADRYFKKFVCRSVTNIDSRLRVVEGIVQDAVAAKA
eukprot:TRINITY_DN69652_c0_g1_i1.p2 TRINITY_DN69652_c0_g1~~TRINITY_DN69652_c0_g1_i1.p2  ORF type:complete len:112 (-),score=19.49 TRINITY_DN69652_c0_g1_i1:249-542(-)